jgi:hypothetical protein
MYGLEARQNLGIILAEYMTRRSRVILCICIPLFITTYVWTERVVYLTAGTLFGACAYITKQFTYYFPFHKDLHLLSELLTRSSHIALRQTFEKPFAKSTQGKWIYQSNISWDKNQYALSKIPTHSHEDRDLVSFLKMRWLSKANGFYPFEINFVLPCFGLEYQVSPETKNSYARDPFTQSSLVYENRIKALKKTMPETKPYPLILARPNLCKNHFHSYCQLDTDLSYLQKKAPVIFDFSSAIFTDSWEKIRENFLKKCQENSIPPDQLICAQIIHFGDEKPTGIQILPLLNQEKEFKSMLKWISSTGLTANPSELDRIVGSTVAPKEGRFEIEQTSLNLEPISGLDEPTTLMVEGLFSNLKAISQMDKKMNDTEKAIIQLSFSNLNQQIQNIREKKLSFYQTMISLEEAYSNLNAVLEIFSPFTHEDFSSIYADLISPPLALKEMTTYSLLATGMTSVNAILNKVEKTIQRKPRVIYGDNTYFECIHLAQENCLALSEHQAMSCDFETADIYLAQFNPVLRRDHDVTSVYQIEQVANNIHKALSANRLQPLTVVLDATIEWLKSNRIQALLEEFQSEIVQGKLGIFCYRSGLKFDLFGMDNHTGSPCFMAHNQDPYWQLFDEIFVDPAFLTDRLSLQWFALAFKNSSRELDLYRNQIFANTRSLLQTIPADLYDSQAPYHIIQCKDDADPSFIDIKVTGPFHQFRAAAIVGGSLYLDSMQAKHPIFCRRSFGFYHPNLGIIFGEKSSTIRLTLGLDPSQIDIFAECLIKLSTDTVPLSRKTSKKDVQCPDT